MATSVVNLPTTVGFSVQSTVTGTRALATVYQNTTGKPMLVCCSVNVASTDVLEAYSENNVAPTNVVAYQGAPANIHRSITMVVPVSWYYKFVCAGATLAYWTEWS